MRNVAPKGAVWVGYPLRVEGITVSPVGACRTQINIDNSTTNTH